MRKVELTIEGMSCGHCLAAVRRTLEEAPGVEVEAVELGRARVTVNEGRADPGDVARALSDAGYPAEWIEAAHE